MGLGASGNRRQTVENSARRSFTVTSAGSYNLEQADVAQLVEQSIRNRQVIGSSPIVGSMKPAVGNRQLAISLSRDRSTLLAILKKEDPVFRLSANCQLLSADTNEKAAPAQGSLFF